MILIWDKLKIEIRYIFISYSKIKAKKKRKDIKILEENINTIHEALKTGNAQEQEVYNTQLIVTKTKLENIFEDKLRGAKIRSRAKWIEEGGKYTKYFLSLDKSRQIHKAINALINKTGELVQDQDAILEMTKLFYEKLYHTTEQVKVKAYLKNIKNLTFINENDNISCEGKIKIEEI